MPTHEPGVASRVIAGSSGRNVGELEVPTGVWGGPVRLEIRLFADAPVPDLELWEDVDEDFLLITSGTAVISTQAAAYGRISIPSDQYRVRVSARGRDLARDLIAQEAVEQYLIDLWVSVDRETLPLKVTSSEARSRWR